MSSLSHIGILLLCLVVSSLGLEAVGRFRQNAQMLYETLKLTCDEDGDKIKVSDVTYRITNCQNSEFNPQEPAADENRRRVDGCTGKRTCAVPPDNLKPPYMPMKVNNCFNRNSFEIVISYSCVPQERIRSMCSSISSQDHLGYLSTPHYPMLLKPGEPAAPCRCRLEATMNSRIDLVLLEANLVSNASDEDLNKCQIETSKQYLHVEYNHDMSETYLLCAHKYNHPMPSSPTYSLMFENPVGREAGALWLQYSADQPNAVVEVKCYEPVVTTVAPIHYTNQFQDYGSSTRLILGSVAAFLFIIIVIALLILTVKHRRKSSKHCNTLSEKKIRHYMMEKYSKKARRERKLQKNVNTPMASVTPRELPSYQETHFDTPDDGMSYSKPTAHIHPQLSLSENMNMMAEDDPKTSIVKTNPKYSTFTSTYLPKQTFETDSEGSISSTSKHSKQSQKSIASGSTGSASSQSSHRQHTDPTWTEVAQDPDYSDNWMKPLQPQPQSSMSNSVYTSADERNSLLHKPMVSFSTGGSTIIDPPDMSLIPLMQRSEDSRLMSDDEEMDIKNVNRNLISTSPYKSPGVVVRPVLKSSNSSRSTTPKRDCVKFSSDIAESSPPTPRRYETPSQYGTAQSTWSPRAVTSQPKAPPPVPSKPKPSVKAPISSFAHSSKLIVDIKSAPRKSRSLPRHNRRLNSVPVLNTAGLSDALYAPKRQKRRYASDNEKSSPSSQEMISPSSPYLTELQALQQPFIQDSYEGGRASTTPRSTYSEGYRRLPIDETDDQLMITIDPHTPKFSRRKNSYQ